MEVNGSFHSAFSPPRRPGRGSDVTTEVPPYGTPYGPPACHDGTKPSTVCGADFRDWGHGGKLARNGYADADAGTGGVSTFNVLNGTGIDGSDGAPDGSPNSWSLNGSWELGWSPGAEECSWLLKT